MQIGPYNRIFLLNEGEVGKNNAESNDAFKSIEADRDMSLNSPPVGFTFCGA